MNVIQIRANLTYEFGFKSQYIKVEKRSYGLIILRNKLNHYDYEVSIFSEFLLDEYGNSSIDTQRKRGYQIVGFLNYLLSENKIDGINELEFSQGTDYLNNLKSVGKATVQEHEYVIRNFYDYLVSKHFFQGRINNSITNGKKKSYFNVGYPDETRIEILHDIPEQYLDLFLQIAIKVANPIAFGIYLQIFGGLRVSEVASVRFEGTELVGIGGEYGFRVTLNKGQILREDIKNNTVSTVKKKRQQYIDPFEPFSEQNFGLTLFHNHIKTYIPSDGTGALFVNPRNTKKKGKAMTRKNYARYFNRVKEEFCRQLMGPKSKPEEREYGKYLRKVRWSTHIGRGIFTNMKARNLKNAVQVQFARGDSSVDSAIEYYERTQVIQNSKAAHINQVQFIRELRQNKRSDESEVRVATNEVKRIIAMDGETKKSLENMEYQDSKEIDFFETE